MPTLSQKPTHRYSLGMLPTPVHRWHVPGVPDDVELYIKRDDLTGMQLSGNKARFCVER
jgi:1-aminocyclopropane-1-carboxylate deaminase/D-cysteine desulfhydrase-like pyridoxal-dependent ACC family enzyme